MARKQVASSASATVVTAEVTMIFQTGQRRVRRDVAFQGREHLLEVLSTARDWAAGSPEERRDVMCWSRGYLSATPVTQALEQIQRQIEREREVDLHIPF